MYEHVKVFRYVHDIALLLVDGIVYPYTYIPHHLRCY
jgi:hypothetical protein